MMAPVATMYHHAYPNNGFLQQFLVPLTLPLPPSTQHPQHLTSTSSSSSHALIATTTTSGPSIEALLPTPLPSPYQPGEYDVVCGRGKGSYNRPGNKKFRKIVHKHVAEYTSAKTKLDKSAVLNGIIEKVRAQNQGTAQFIKYDKKQGWFVISDDQAREKVGHAIREAIAAIESASAKEESKKQFHDKQNDLLEQQRRLFLSMVSNCPKGGSGTSDEDDDGGAGGDDETSGDHDDGSGEAA